MGWLAQNGKFGQLTFQDVNQSFHMLMVTIQLHLEEDYNHSSRSTYGGKTRNGNHLSRSERR